MVSFLAQLDGADRLSVDGADRQAARELCVDALALLARLRRRIEEGRDPDDPDAAALDALADASSAGALPAHLLALLLLARCAPLACPRSSHPALEPPCAGSRGARTMPSPTATAPWPWTTD